MSELPRPFRSFRDQHTDIHAAYEDLASLCHQGPLDSRTRELVKLGIAVGASAEGAVKSHARRALEQGSTEEEVEHAVILALTTVGFPAMIAAREWVNEVFASRD